MQLNTISAKNGVSFLMRTGERLRVVSPEGQQVSDLFCFNASDYAESLSCARTMDAAESVFVTAGDALVSNRGNPLLSLVLDTCGRHDLLMPPCREEENGHVGCYENLSHAFSPFGIGADQVGPTFNLFMHVDIVDGRLVIQTPQSRPGDEVIMEAQMDLVVGLTACAHLQTNGGSLKPMLWRIEPSLR